MSSTRVILFLVASVFIAGLSAAFLQGSLRTPLSVQTAEPYRLAKNWLINNFQPETGLFVYSLNVGSGEISNDNNAIRQLMASRILAQESAVRPDLLEMHRQNLEAWFANWYRLDHGNGYVYFNDKSKLGANAMLLRTLVVSPLFGEYKDEAKALAQICREVGKRLGKNITTVNGRLKRALFRIVIY